MKRKKFLQMQIAKYDLKILEWENTYRRMTFMMDSSKIAEEGRLNVIRWLVERAGGTDMQSALAGAALGGRREIAEYLIERGAVVTTKTIMCALSGVDGKVSKWLSTLHEGPLEFVINHITLTLALKRRHAWVAELLVDRGHNFGLRELHFANTLDRRLYTKMRRLLKGHSHHKILERMLRSGDVEEASWLLKKFSADEAREIKMFGKYKTSDLNALRWMRKNNINADHRGSWKLAIKRGDTNVISEVRVLLGSAYKWAHVYAALYCQPRVTSWLVKYAPECVFDEKLYLKLMKKGCYNLRYLTDNSCPRRPDRFLQIYAELISQKKKREMLALRGANCPCDVEQLIPLAGTEMCEWMRANAWFY
jgi:hypothetical protein